MKLNSKLKRIRSVGTPSPYYNTSSHSNSSSTAADSISISNSASASTPPARLELKSKWAGRRSFSTGPGPVSCSSHYRAPQHSATARYKISLLKSKLLLHRVCRAGQISFSFDFSSRRASGVEAEAEFEIEIKSAAVEEEFECELVL